MTYANHGKTNTVSFYVYKVPKIVKLIEADHKKVVSRAWEEREMGVVVQLV